jgi:hypothetical protein
MTAWTDLVKKTYEKNKHKSGYKLGDAMKDASKMKKHMKGGNDMMDSNEKDDNETFVDKDIDEDMQSVSIGGKKRRHRTIKKRKGSKKSRKHRSRRRR